MYDLATFSRRVKELYRQSYPYDSGHRANQSDLASAVGLAMAELNRRLNGARSALLTDRDVHAIVRVLSEWGAITTQAEALDLLDLVCCPQFSQVEWNSPPLDSLAPLRSTAAGSEQSLPHRAEITNLPLELSSFVGRGREHAEVARLLGESRLLTLTGPGGVGKTRLALNVAAALTPRFQDGVWLVELAGLSEPELVPQAIAGVLKIREQPGKSLVESMRDALERRELLLVLDNCEHLTMAAAMAALQLLSYCPHLRVLATSREVLRIDGEVSFSVPPLRLPAAQAKLWLGRMASYPAIALFVARARAGRPGFRLSDSNAAAVLEICQRLDGLPLAIELTAARLRMMGVGQIREELSDRFGLLVGGRRDQPARQQSLFAMIDWSYQLLNQTEQRLFRALSVFAGGFVLEAARAVAAGQLEESGSVVAVLGQLVDKSLVIGSVSSGEGRFRMLETIREYARNQLHEQGELDLMLAQHADYIMRLVEQARPELSGPDQPAWLTRLDAEIDNIRAALGWLLVNRPAMAIATVGLLTNYWIMRERLSEGRKWVADALKGETTDKADLARALNAAGSLALFQRDLVVAKSYTEQALELQRDLRDKYGLVDTLDILASITRDLGDYATARHYYEESLALADWNATRLYAVNPLNQGHLTMEAGDYIAARAFFEQSLQVAREQGYQDVIGGALNALGDIDFEEGDYDEALRRCDEAHMAYEAYSQGAGGYETTTRGLVAIAEGDYVKASELLEDNLRMAHEWGSNPAIGGALISLGRVEFAQQHIVAASSRFKQGLQLLRDSGLKREIAETLTFVGDTEAAAGSKAAARKAVNLISYSTQLLNICGAALSRSQVPLKEAALAACRASLDEEEFAAAWVVGEAMTMEQAIDYALGQAPKG